MLSTLLAPVFPRDSRVLGIATIQYRTHRCITITCGAILPDGAVFPACVARSILGQPDER